MKLKLTTIGYWGAYPAKNEATSCYIVQDGDTSIVLDCGSGALAKLQNVMALEAIDAVFISHIHTDHIADLYCLEYAMLIKTQLGQRKKPLDVYVYTEHLERLPLEFPEIIHVHPIQLDDSITVGSFTLTFLENFHEVPCVAMKVTNAEGKTIVYTADTGMNKELSTFIGSSDVLLIECSFFEHQRGFVKGHLSTDEVGEIVNASNPGQVILTHFPHFGEIAQLVKEVESKTGRPIDFAREGYSITL